MLSGFGIRTMSHGRRRATQPTGYHVGLGVAARHRHLPGRARRRAAARGRRRSAEALLAALHAFDGRPPELFAGDARSEHPVPMPYPAACRPQAWSAAAAVSLVASLAGLRADVPGGRVHASPVAPWPLGPTRLDGLRAGGRDLAVDVAADGTPTVTW